MKKEALIARKLGDNALLSLINRYDSFLPAAYFGKKQTRKQKQAADNVIIIEHKLNEENLVEQNGSFARTNLFGSVGPGGWHVICIK